MFLEGAVEGSFVNQHQLRQSARHQTLPYVLCAITINIIFPHLIKHLSSSQHVFDMFIFFVSILVLLSCITHLFELNKLIMYQLLNYHSTSHTPPLHPYAPPCTTMHHHAPSFTTMHHHAPPCTTQSPCIGTEGSYQGGIR